jgi:DNA-binding SARP family transcriptional activator/tetratricopeptide (TPR) repeat protein
MSLPVRFGILGRLELYASDGSPVDVGGAQARLITAALVAADGRPLSSDFLIDAIWGDRPPTSGVGSLQAHISRLRRHIGTDALVWQAPSYRLVVARDEVDAWRFERLADEGRAALDADDAELGRKLLLEADGLWRGVALPEVREIDPFRGVASRLEERRLVAAEDRFEAELALGRHELVVGELAEAVIAQPFREVLRSQLALALYRSGRQAEALRSISSARTTFAEELGISIGAELGKLEVAILDHDPTLDRAPPPARTTASALRQRDPLSMPLVGRKTELETLAAALDEAAVGQASVIVEGAPGVGKTRLLEAFTSAAGDVGAMTAWGTGYEGSAAPPWWPWLRILEAIVDMVPTASCEALERLLHPSDEGAVVSAGLRFELHEAVRRALSLAAADRRLVIVLDDLQWADEASLELLAHLSRTVEQERILFVVGLRDLEIGLSNPVTRVLGELSRRRNSRRIQLGPLTGAEIAALLSDEAGVDLPDEVATAINRRAEGNAFFALELWRDYHDRGFSPEQSLPCTVPAALADVVRQRLDRLPAATRDLLHVAAVIGRNVDSALLLRAAAREADAFDDLEPAFAHRFLDEEASSPGHFRFVHPLVRDVLLNEITTLQEARLHLRVADALEQRAGMSDAEAEIVAEHLYAARSLGVGSRAAVALQRAAGVAIRRSAYATAEDMLDRSALLLLTAEGVPDRPNAELDVLVALFFAQRATRGHDVALSRPPYLRARQLARSTGRLDVQARLLWAEWVGVDKACDWARSAQLADELRQLAADTGIGMIEGLSQHADGVIHWHSGEYAAAAAALDRAAKLNRAWAEASQGSVQAMVSPLSPIAWPRGHPVVPFLHMLIGDREDPIEEFERMAADEAQPFGSAVVWMFAAFGALAIGDIEASVAAGTRGFDADPDQLFSYWGPGAHIALGAALAVRGDIDEGVDLVARSMPRYLASGTRIFLPLVHARLAQAMSRQGRFDEATAELLHAVTLNDEFSERWLEPVLSAVGAELAFLQDRDTSTAGERLASAEALARSQGALGIARDVARIAASLLGRAEHAASP